jgi:hypothetical protein
VNNINWASVVPAFILLGSAASNAFGYPALGVLISDPHTAQLATSALAGIAGLVTVFSQGIQHPVTSVTVPAVAVSVSSPALSASQVATVASAKAASGAPV